MASQPGLGDSPGRVSTGRHDTRHNMALVSADVRRATETYGVQECPWTPRFNSTLARARHPVVLSACTTLPRHCCVLLCRVSTKRKGWLFICIGPSTNSASPRLAHLTLPTVRGSKPLALVAQTLPNLP